MVGKNAIVLRNTRRKACAFQPTQGFQGFKLSRCVTQPQALEAINVSKIPSSKEGRDFFKFQAMFVHYQHEPLATAKSFSDSRNLFIRDEDKSGEDEEKLA